MQVTIKGKPYETGKLALYHAIEAMETASLGEKENLAFMLDTVAQSLVNGTEKIPYDEITTEKKDEYMKLIKFNMTILEVSEIFNKLAEEMKGNGDENEGKPKP